VQDLTILGFFTPLPFQLQLNLNANTERVNSLNVEQPGCFDETGTREYLPDKNPGRDSQIKHHQQLKGEARKL